MAKQKSSTQRKNKDVSTPIRPQLADIAHELSIKFGSIGVLLNEMYRHGAGDRLFDIPELHEPSCFSNHIDVSSTIIGRHLPIFYAYAYDGVVLPGHERTVDLSGGSSAEMLSDFVELFARQTYYMELAEDTAAGGADFVLGGLQDMIERMRARHWLDSEYSLSIAHLALLANMNERSVKNATSALGKSRLALNASGEVDHSVAIQWLSERAGRGFTPTRRVQFPSEGAESEVQLDAIEIPAFIADRLRARFGAEALKAWQRDIDACSNYTEVQSAGFRITEQAAELAQLDRKEIASATMYPLAIPPRNCGGLAKALGVDPTWFTLQVMRALYPQEMDMVLNPSHYRTPLRSAEAEPGALDAIEIVLTASMITHGYLDMPTYAKALFPSDCFSAPQGDAPPTTVIIQYGMDQKVETEIQVKSEKTISLRKRFTAWLQSELHAQPGDRVRVERKAERVYALRFQPVAITAV
jgi:hypothetical protein